jgi:hypothetical protein
MFGSSTIERQRRRIIREDRKFLEARVRRLLTNYLSATETQKPRYFEAVAGASAGCHPENSVSLLENIQVAKITAERAEAVVRRRLEAEKDNSQLERFITDAYATVAVAFRRAAGTYVDDKRMQKLGTAAVHLLTMATSRLMAESNGLSRNTTEMNI